MKKDGKLFVISGPSGVGKNTVINEFLKQNRDFALSVSTTTRVPRAGEIDGVNYHFTTKENFKNLIQQGKFLEWAEFNGNFYGTRLDLIQEFLESGQSLILEIDTQGALQVKAKIPQAVLIFIQPPCIDDLKKRLLHRGTETHDVIQNRLNIALGELEQAKKFDFNVVNDEIENAVSALEKITFQP